MSDDSNNNKALKFIKTIHKTIVLKKMILKGDSVLVGFSGGPDSVALVHSLLKIKETYHLKIGIAHLNHSLRNKESDRDAEFSRNFAENQMLPYYYEKCDVREFQREHNMSMEETGRTLRYEFFKEIAQKNRYNRIALGHHMDDNAELILMYLFRGSGPLGLSGIPPKRDNLIIRPLINTTRSDILDFLENKKIQYVVDSSNHNTKILRNKIRHELIPELKKSYNPKIVETLNRFGEIIRNEESWINEIIFPQFKKIILSETGDTLLLNFNGFNKFHLAVKRRVLRHAIRVIKSDLRKISLFHIDSVINQTEINSENWIIDLPDRIRVKKECHKLIIFREKIGVRYSGKDSTAFDKNNTFFQYNINKPIEKTEIIHIIESGIYLKFLEERVEDIDNIKLTKKNIVYFDEDKLNFPLIVRNVKAGDRFNPFGMKGTQKLKNFFINNKVPQNQRTVCPVLINRNDIIWVVGHRRSELFKVSPGTTKKVLKIEYFFA